MSVKFPVPHGEGRRSSCEFWWVRAATLFGRLKPPMSELESDAARRAGYLGVGLDTALTGLLDHGVPGPGGLLDRRHPLVSAETPPTGFRDGASTDSATGAAQRP